MRLSVSGIIILVRSVRQLRFGKKKFLMRGRSENFRSSIIQEMRLYNGIFSDEAQKGGKLGPGHQNGRTICAV